MEQLEKEVMAHPRHHVDVLRQTYKLVQKIKTIAKIEFKIHLIQRI